MNQLNQRKKFFFSEVELFYWNEPKENNLTSCPLVSLLYFLNKLCFVVDALLYLIILTREADGEEEKSEKDFENSYLYQSNPIFARYATIGSSSFMIYC